MSRTEERWDELLTTWAAGEIGGKSAGVSVNVYSGLNRDDGPPRIPLPPLGEYLDLDKLVRQLPEDQYAAVRAWYVWTGTAREKARSLKIHQDTLTDRVRAAKYRLEDLDQARKAAQRRMSEGMRA